MENGFFLFFESLHYHPFALLLLPLLVSNFLVSLPPEQQHFFLKLLSSEHALFLELLSLDSLLLDLLIGIEAQLLGVRIQLTFEFLINPKSLRNIFLNNVGPNFLDAEDVLLFLSLFGN